MPTTNHRSTNGGPSSHNMLTKSRNRVASEPGLASKKSTKSNIDLSGTSVDGRGTATVGAQRPSTSGQQQGPIARKRRASITVYDQPSSLNSRLRQLETDMLRLNEDRHKLFDDTHSTLAQYDVKLKEIQTILRSRQDNVEKYVEDMAMLLEARVEFERQANLLREKHERLQDKFVQRETSISREIKILKNKFEIIEKNRHFKALQKHAMTDNGSSDLDAKNLMDSVMGDAKETIDGRNRGARGSTDRSLGSASSRVGMATQNESRKGSNKSKTLKLRNLVRRIITGRRFRPTRHKSQDNHAAKATITTSAATAIVNCEPGNKPATSQSQTSADPTNPNRVPHGSLWRCFRLLRWWCNMKHRPSVNTTQ